MLSNKGVELVEVVQDTPLKPGDKLVVRLTITSDRSLEYVHLKDMRAACLEPVSQISQYQWQGALGYYQAPKDASMNKRRGRINRDNFALPLKRPMIRCSELKCADVSSHQDQS